MKSVFLFLLSLATVSAFVVQPRAIVSKNGVAMSMIMTDAPVSAPEAPIVSRAMEGTNYLEQQKATSFNQFLTSTSSIESSTSLVSLKDRPPPPTAEEIAAKKANFNFWFWGGGFVAPFLATFYYFGLKFWER
jgi:hypothetical protein